MAWLEQHPTAGTFQIVFRLGEAKFKRSLKTSDAREAAGRLARFEENIRLVESGRLVMPEQADPGAFLLSDGKLNGKPKVAERLALGELIERYKAALSANDRVMTSCIRWHSWRRTPAPAVANSAALGKSTMTSRRRRS